MASGYTYNLSSGQLLTLVNQGEQTTVMISSGAGTQQQQSSNGFATGSWVGEPRLYKVGAGLFITLSTPLQTYYIQYQQGQVQVSTEVSTEVMDEVARSQPIPMQPMAKLPDAPTLIMPPMQPMAGMNPMPKMPDMQMNNPMSMTMGNMSMSMADATAKATSKTTTDTTHQPASEASQSNKKFCTQCGSPIAPTDKFCGQCGTALT